MSHELRTPLNSILILGQQLAENGDGNLSPRQVEFAQTIHGAGTDLLNLISDILDLSKIESGTVTVECEELPFSHLRDLVQRNFGHVAEARKLMFNNEFDPALAAGQMTTDPKRLLQVLKNLLSNAFKFTEQGGVRLEVAPATGGLVAGSSGAQQGRARSCASRVTDSGIGIPPEKQKLIFEAFQQADAGTSRKYGGTGLGLAISRELANLLGGEIRLSSRARRGQHVHAVPAAQVRRAGFGQSRVAQGRLGRAELPADRAAGARASRRSRTTARTCSRAIPCCSSPRTIRTTRASLLALARDHGFKALVAMRGAEALALARKYKPTAVSLDIFLPDMLGWTVLSQLKQDPATRHIPVQICTVEEERQHGLERGAFAYLNKPLTTDSIEAAFDRIKRFAEPRTRQLLVVEDDAAERMSIEELIRHDDVQITSVGTGAEALAAMHERDFDCVVLDLRLPDISGFELLARDPEGAEAARRADRRVHRPRARRRRRDAAAQDGEEHRAEGRAVAGAPARRDGALPAPRGRRSAAVQAAHAGEPQPERRSADRQEGAGRRRRRAQHLRADEPARAAPHADGRGRVGRGGDRRRAEEPRTSRSC